MPLVPNYTGELRSGNDIQQNYLSDAATPAAFGVGVAEAESRLGRQISRSADEVGDIALRQQEVYNQAATVDMDNQATIANAKLTADFNQKSGADAMRAMPDYLAAVKANHDEILANAPNSAVARRASEHFSRVYAGLTQNATEHSAQQLKVYSVNQNLARARLANDAAGALDPEDTEGFRKQLAINEGSIRQAAKINGISPEDTEVAVKQSLGQAWASRLSGMASTGKAEQARKEFDKNRGQIYDPDGKIDTMIYNQQVNEGSKRTAHDLLTGDLPGVKDRENYAMSVLSQKVGKIGAAGLVGGFHQESPGLNPNGNNPGDGADGSDSIGIGQWNADRAKALAKFARERGTPINDFKTQIAFVEKELDEKPDLAAALRGAKTAAEAAQIANSYYEVSKDKPDGTDREQQGFANRVSHATRLAAADIKEPRNGLGPLSPENHVQDTERAAAAEAENKFPGDINARDLYVNRIRSEHNQQKAEYEQARRENVQTINDIAFGDELHPPTLDAVRSNPQYVQAIQNLQRVPGGQALIGKVEKAIANAHQNPPMTVEREGRWSDIQGIHDSDPQRFMKIDPSGEDLPYKYRHQITAQQGKLRDTMEADPKLQSAMSYLKQTGVLGEAGLKSNTQTKTYPDTDRFIGQLTQMMKTYQGQHPGQIPGNDDIKDMATILLRRRANEGWLGTHTIDWPISFHPGEKPEFRGAVPADTADKIKSDYIKANGQASWDAQIAKEPNYIRNLYSARLYTEATRKQRKGAVIE